MGFLAVLVFMAAAVPCLAQSVEVGVRVVDGQDAIPDEVPFIVSLRRSGNHICGGTLIGRNLIVTAAHCFKNVKLNRVLVGDVRRDGSSASAEILKVRHKKRHPKYKRITDENDIALITLKDHITSEMASTIDFATSSSSHSSCYIAGWGKDSSGAGVLTLQLAATTIVNSSECIDFFKDRTSRVFKEETMICSKSSSNVACKGDGGGPLFCGNGEKKELVGVVSWGLKSCSPGTPVVYTKVSAYQNWIRDYLQKRHESEELWD